MIKKYIKKPIPIEAIQYNGKNLNELIDFSDNIVYKSDNDIYVHTLEGDMKMKNKTGDYLIKGIHGEYYFCEKSIFEESYQEATIDDRSYMCCQTMY